MWKDNVIVCACFLVWLWLTAPASWAHETFREDLYLRTIADQHVEATWKFRIEFEPTQEHLCSIIGEKEGEIPELCHFNQFPSEISDIFYETGASRFSLVLVGGKWQPYWGQSEFLKSFPGPSGTSLEVEFPQKYHKQMSWQRQEEIAERKSLKLHQMLSNLLGLDLDTSSKYGTVHRYPISLIKTENSYTSMKSRFNTADDIFEDDLPKVEGASSTRRGTHSHGPHSPVSSGEASHTYRSRSEHPRQKPSLNHLWPWLRLMPCSTGQPNNPPSFDAEVEGHKDTDDESDEYGLGGLSSLIDYEVLFGSEFYAFGLKAEKLNCDEKSSSSNSSVFDDNKCKFMLETEISSMLSHVIHETSILSQDNSMRSGEFSLLSLLDKVHLHQPRPRTSSQSSKDVHLNKQPIALQTINMKQTLETVENGENDKKRRSGYHVNPKDGENDMFDGIIRNRGLPSVVSMVSYADKVLSSVSGCQPYSSNKNDRGGDKNDWSHSYIHIITPFEIMSSSTENKFHHPNSDRNDDGFSDIWLSNRTMEFGAVPFSTQIVPLLKNDDHNANYNDMLSMQSQHSWKKGYSKIRSNKVASFTTASVGSYYSQLSKLETQLQSRTRSEDLVALSQNEVELKKSLLFEEKRKRLTLPWFTIKAYPSISANRLAVKPTASSASSLHEDKVVEEECGLNNGLVLPKPLLFAPLSHTVSDQWFDASTSIPLISKRYNQYEGWMWSATIETQLQDLSFLTEQASTPPTPPTPTSSYSSSTLNERGPQCHVLTITEPIIDKITSPLLHSLKINLFASFDNTRSSSSTFENSDINHPFTFLLHEIPHQFTTLSSHDVIGGKDSNTYQTVTSQLEIYLPLNSNCFSMKESNQSNAKKHNNHQLEFNNYSKLLEIFKDKSPRETKKFLQEEINDNDDQQIIKNMSSVYVEIKYDFTVSIIPMEHWPPDGARGFDMPPSRASLFSIHKDTQEVLTKRTTSSISYSSGPLLLPPMLDFSMPFNVITLTCTLFAGLLGSMLNILTKNLQKKKKEPSQRQLGLLAKLSLFIRSGRARVTKQR